MKTVTISAHLEYQFPQPADVLLAIEVAQLPDQTLISDLLTIRGAGPLINKHGLDNIGRRTWFEADGLLTIDYTAQVAIDRPATSLAGLNSVPHSDLDDASIAYLMPSRYCPSDLLENFVADTFQEGDKGQQVEAMAAWIYDHIAYVPGSSGYRATASDIFLSRQGVCRDFAHLMIAFARADGIPARMVSAYALDLDPPDFHAVCEVYLNHHWHLVDATRLVPETDLARIAVGRDATDVGFMTIFGMAEMVSQSILVTSGS